MGFVADVFDVTLIDPVTQDAFASTTLQDANIEFSLESTDITGGQGAQLLGVLHSTRNININLTEVSFKYDWLARQLGTDVTTGTAIAYAKPEFYEVATASVTLNKEPNADDHGVIAYTEDGQRITGFTVTGSDVDFTAATPTVADGDTVEIRSYKYDTDATTEIVEFDVAKFPKGVIAVLETVEISGDERITHTIQYQFENSVPDGNITLNTASSREAQTTAMMLRVIKPQNSTNVGRALRIPIAAV
ncbi:hypothetical protein [Aquibacillus saliphilus]|uniref:hypothetical protein n=1 Tax=Aquibacillus saliphilus TaxID=1909422 RepID=UPI001CEFE038|nr:hypothetical protein [Aquibacillus saliphilus]